MVLGAERFAGAMHSDVLDIGRHPAGAVSRGLIELIQDALGRPVEVPVIVARGERDGPVFGLTAAVHGNELNGIPVLFRLFDRIDCRALRGTVVGVVVSNLAGYFRFSREYADGVDLNHCFPGRPDGSESEVYAHRLVDRIVKHFDVLIDLHTASFGRVNSLYVRADMRDPATARMAYRQRPQIILHNQPSDHTLRGTAEELGIAAITTEIGDPQRFQPEFVRRSLVGVRAVLMDRGMIPRRQLAPGRPPILCARSEWMYTDVGGILEVFPGVTDRVSDGETIARVRNVFGDITREFVAPRDCVVIGKSVNPVARTGARIVHLGEVATVDDGFAVPDSDVVNGEVDGARTN